MAERGDESHESKETISPDEGGVGPANPPPSSEPKDPTPHPEPDEADR